MLIDKSGGHQQGTNAGAADIKDLAQVDEQDARAGPDLLRELVRERAGARRVEAPLRTGDRNSIVKIDGHFHDTGTAPMFYST